MELCRKCKQNYAGFPIAIIMLKLIYPLLSLIIQEKQIISLDISHNCGIIIFTHNTAFKEVQMGKSRTRDPKEKALQDSGALNTHPVTDALFSDSDFFDARDLVQVKYEMLRKVQKEGESVSSAAASFGFSRQSFYKVLSDFQRKGIAGLLPQKRGPQGGHKLTAEVMEFIKEFSTMEQPMSIPALLDEVERRFGVRVHRRSLERAQQRCEKKMASIRGKKNREI